MALNKILKHVGNSSSTYECEVFHIASDGTATRLDHADGAFRAVPATPKIPLVQIGTTGVFIRNESRSAWADGNYVQIANIVGVTYSEDAVEFEMKNDAEVALSGKPTLAEMLAGGTAKESTLLALGVQVAALPTVVQISAAVVALGGIGGIITGVVDAGVTVSSSFNPISMEKGEKKVIAYQIKENGVAIDVSAYTFTFGVKRDLYDTVYAFATVAGVISADDDGVDSIVTFTIPKDSTKALAVIESGRYSVGMYDGVGNKVALTPPGGVSFRLTEDILDVA